VALPLAYLKSPVNGQLYTTTDESHILLDRVTFVAIVVIASFETRVAAGFGAHQIGAAILSGPSAIVRRDFQPVLALVPHEYGDSKLRRRG
jgi:hypothetical protein